MTAQGVECRGYLPGSGNPDNQEILFPDPVFHQEPSGTLEQALHDAAVEARRDQADPDTGRIGGRLHFGAGGGPVATGLEESSNGRDGEIRTRDPLNPIQVRYQTAPRPDRAAFSTQSSRLATTHRSGDRSVVLDACLRLEFRRKLARLRDERRYPALEPLDPSSQGPQFAYTGGVRAIGRTIERVHRRRRLHTHRFRLRIVALRRQSLLRGQLVVASDLTGRLLRHDQWLPADTAFLKFRGRASSLRWQW